MSASTTVDPSAPFEPRRRRHTARRRDLRRLRDGDVPPARALSGLCVGRRVAHAAPGARHVVDVTTQGFEPKSPPYVPDGEFAPFAVGYVEFPGFLRVEGRLTGRSTRSP